MAYSLGAVKTMFSRMYDHLQITIDDNIYYEGDFLLALAGSGQYYGGGYHAAPDAVPNDGLLDFVLIKRTNVLKVSTMLSRYKRGEHKDDDLGGLVIKHRGKKMHIRSQKPTVINLDGEVVRRSEITFKVEPKAVNLLVPAGAELTYSKIMTI